MIYVGIDIAKLNHFAPAISSNGTELMKPFKFTNDSDGFQMLDSRLSELSYLDDSIIIGLESTTHYGDNLVRYLHSWSLIRFANAQFYYILQQPLIQIDFL